MRLTGTISDWKGKFGWIQPDKPITHPQAKMHKGLVYLSQMDVEAEISGIGAAVSFFVYADGTGLGATNCRPHNGGPPVQHTVTKQPSAREAFAGSMAGGKGSATPTSGKKQRVSNSPITGQVKSFKGDYGWIIPLEPVKHPQFKGAIYVKASDIIGHQPLQAGMTVNFLVYADSQGLGAEQCRLLDDSGVQQPSAASLSQSTGGGAGGASGGTNLGKRERITTVPMTGDVLDWKGTFGWVKPHVPVEHEAARRRQGNVYVAKKDLRTISELKVGQLVQFHVFVDNSGLGGEECKPF